MNWSLIWEWITNIVVSAVGLSAISIATAKLFGKNIIDYWFQRQNEKYKKRLERDLEEYKATLDNQARKIQSSLDIQLEKIRIQYGSLYEKRLVVIKEIHTRLTKLNIYIQAIKKVAAGVDPTKIDNTGMDSNFDLQKFISEYTLYVNDNKLYLSKQLYTILSAAPLLATFDVLKGTTAESLKQILTTQGKSSEDIANANIFKEKLKADFSGLDTNDMLEAIEDEFRKLIGIEE